MLEVLLVSSLRWYQVPGVLLSNRKIRASEPQLYDITSTILKEYGIGNTQGMIGKLLGVRRESVTQTVGLLQKEGLIERARGRLTVLDREKLEKRACECYSAVKLEYERLLPRDRSVPPADQASG